MNQIEKDLLINKTFIDVCNGYSTDDNIFIKHLNILDFYKIQKLKNDSYNLAISKGIPKEIDKLETLIKNKIWLKSDEEFLKECSLMIEGLKDSKKNLLLPSQIKAKELEILEWENKYKEKLFQKDSLLGVTAEKIAEEKSSIYYIYFSLFKNKELSISYFENSSLDEIDLDEVSNIFERFNRITEHVSTENIKNAALYDTFLNLYHINDNVYEFYHRKTYELSYNQINFFHYLKYYSSILSELGNKIPNHFKNDPAKLENFYISYTNIEKHKNKNSSQNNLEFFGSTSEDSVIIGNQQTENDRIDEMLQRGEDVNVFSLIKN